MYENILQKPIKWPSYLSEESDFIDLIEKVYLFFAIFFFTYFRCVVGIYQKDSVIGMI